MSMSHLKIAAYMLGHTKTGLYVSLRIFPRRAKVVKDQVGTLNLRKSICDIELMASKDRQGNAQPGRKDERFAVVP